MADINELILNSEETHKRLRMIFYKYSMGDFDSKKLSDADREELGKLLDQFIEGNKNIENYLSKSYSFKFWFYRQIPTISFITGVLLFNAVLVCSSLGIINILYVIIGITTFAFLIIRIIFFFKGNER